MGHGRIGWPLSSPPYLVKLSHLISFGCYFTSVLSVFYINIAGRGWRKAGEWCGCSESKDTQEENKENCQVTILVPCPTACVTTGVHWYWCYAGTASRHLEAPSGHGSLYCWMERAWERTRDELEGTILWAATHLPALAKKASVCRHLGRKMWRWPRDWRMPPCSWRVLLKKSLTQRKRCLSTTSTLSS